MFRNDFADTASGVEARDKHVRRATTFREVRGRLFMRHLHSAEGQMLMWRKKGVQHLSFVDSFGNDF